ncbi:Glyoxalase/bleomycin resistance protein/dioxygenase [uncultured Mycobacterium sp.]|uniref:Glyoxalase/bleomycin resistance protein/dioxygenase n=1 Tax=uncultured Mycobacterium sp. TaxID=171292 RepID=A0A1Y5PJ92_9MYCO|nr:Glyoxalase/bleomycin resistance protein/dioxygenase [uncultured Mycobacterium sp.]
MEPLGDLRFSHLVVGVTDMDRALQFYRGLLGMDVVFDQTMAGDPFDHALGGAAGNQGRVVGGLIGGVMLELLSLGGETRPARRSIVGNQNISLSVTDLDDTYRRVQDAGYQPDQEPFEIAGVRMFFVKDPDGTAVEFIEFFGTARTSEELHRGVAH